MTIEPGGLTLSQQFPGLMVPVRVIRLTRGGIVIVDPGDYPAAAGRTWLARTSPSGKVHIRAATRDKEGLLPYLTSVVTGWPLVQHANGDPYDCRRANLRAINPVQKSAGQRKATARSGVPTSSRFKGVNWHCGGWRAQISQHRKTRNLGRYQDEEAAARAYDRAAIEMFGAEYAYTNARLGLYEGSAG